MTDERREYIENPLNETVVVDDDIMFCTDKNHIYIVFRF